ncbi:MAG TPA: adenylosuccinate lyase [Chloroflexota bacterium]|nr:adenylosuccinate lyase [Chloroflexota bacterium]
MIPKYSLPEMSRIWSEENKMDKWLAVEIASCEGWAELGEISQDDIAKIRKAKYDLKRIDEIQAVSHHDVISFLRSVAESLGPESRFVHLGLTSSDVIDTALSLQLLDAVDLIHRDLEKLEAALARQAVTYKDTVMIGRTHGIHAEPTTFGFKLAGWVAEARRNLKRLEQAREEVAVGKISGAVGTHANVPPDVEDFVCKKLGLQPVEVSTQIIQRDRHARLMVTLAVIASSLEKMATEIRALQRSDIGEAAEPFSEGQQGSSAMPHKRNPELTERVTGLARLIRGYSIPAMEDVALWHERDISHSSVERVIFQDAFLALDYILNLFTGVMDRLDVFSDRMRENLESTRGLVYSGRVLTALIEKGMKRQDAYEMVQRNAKKVWAEKVSLYDLLAADPEVRKLLSEEELRELFDYRWHLRYIDVGFKRLGLI